MGDAAEDAERRAEWEKEHEGVEETPTFKVIRFNFDAENEVVETGLTLEEAQEYCQREDTSGDGWFCGYTTE